MEERFWIVFGDIHERWERAAEIPDLGKAEGVIVSGDISNVGGKESAVRFLDFMTRLNPRVLAQIGNMDTAQMDALFDARGINIHRRVLELAPGLGLAGVGYSIPTPFGTPSEVDENTMGGWCAEILGAATTRYPHVLLVIHTPPKGEVVDRLYNGMSVGSAGVRAAIETYQPEVVVTGHIHEARGEEWIGKSHVLNPGAFSEGGYVRVSYGAQGLCATLKSLGEKP